MENNTTITLSKPTADELRIMKIKTKVKSLEEVILDLIKFHKKKWVK